MAARKKAAKAPKAPASAYEKRLEIYRRIEQDRKSRVLCYVTGDRPGLETQVSHEVLRLFVPLLDGLFPTNKISLVLYTKGGSTLTAWSLINMLRMFCEDLEIIVPAVAHSAGTLMCLGANRVVMTKQATLGPIDPSITGPLNPLVPGNPNPNVRAPVSVESIKGYIQMAKDDFGVKEMTPVLIDLAQKVHPLVLGSIFRSKSQIQTLAKQLLRHSVQNAATQRRIVNFLCTETGSHDYTINRREAKDLGLTVEKCSDKMYSHLKALQTLIDQELELNQPYNQHTILAGQPEASYDLPRCLIEGTGAPGYVFASTGTLKKVQVVGPAGPQDAIQDDRKFEGWRPR